MLWTASETPSNTFEAVLGELDSAKSTHTLLGGLDKFRALHADHALGPRSKQMLEVIKAFEDSPDDYSPSLAIDTTNVDPKVSGSIFKKCFTDYLSMKSFVDRVQGDIKSLIEDGKKKITIRKLNEKAQALRHRFGQELQARVTGLQTR